MPPRYGFTAPLERMQTFFSRSRETLDELRWEGWLDREGGIVQRVVCDLLRDQELALGTSRPEIRRRARGRGMYHRIHWQSENIEVTLLWWNQGDTDYSLALEVAMLASSEEWFAQIVRDRTQLTTVAKGVLHTTAPDSWPGAPVEAPAVLPVPQQGLLIAPPGMANIGPAAQPAAPPAVPSTPMTATPTPTAPPPEPEIAHRLTQASPMEQAPKAAVQQVRSGTSRPRKSRCDPW